MQKRASILPSDLGVNGTRLTTVRTGTNLELIFNMEPKAFVRGLSRMSLRHRRAGTLSFGIQNDSRFAALPNTRPSTKAKDPAILIYWICRRMVHRRA